MDLERRRVGNRTPGIVAACVTGAVVLLGWWIGAGGWPGEPSACIAAGDCSCEAFSGGLVVQPVNTLSSLVFVVAGVGLLLRATAGRLLSRVYAVLVMFLGLGSAAFHASMTEWGGWLDLLAIHVFLGFVVIVDVGRVLVRPDRWVATALAGTTVAAAPVLWWMDNGLGKYTVAALVVLVVGLEWRIAGIATGRDRRWLAGAAALFAVGLVVQWLGRGGGVLCDAEGVWQVHALWHVLAAGGTVALGRYLLDPA